MNFRYLTQRDLAHMTPAMKARRQANWQGLIRGLQQEHERMFHSPERVTELLGALNPPKPCIEAGCDSVVYAKSRCESHYRAHYRAQRRARKVVAA